MKKAILVLNGVSLNKSEIEYISSQQNQGVFLMCADGGYAHIKGVLKPDVVIGDFDSYSLSDVENGIKTIVYQVEKDFTDGHICIETLVEEGYQNIEIFGATGGERSDHFLSNFSLLALANKNGASAVIKDSYFDIYFFDKPFDLNVKKEKTFSVVPFTDTAHIISSTGLKYAINDIMLNKLHMLAISNSTIDTKVSVELLSGGVLVFVQK